MASKDESAAGKWKVTTLEEKFVSNIKGIIEERVGSRNVNTATIWETLDIQPDELSEEFIDINEQSGCDEKDDDPEEVMPEKKKTQSTLDWRSCWRDFKTWKVLRM